MRTDLVVERILVDLRGNRLLLEFDRPIAGPRQAPAIIDIGALGRLLGVEIAGAYLAISDPVAGADLQGRSVELTVQIANDRRRVALPRRGEGWELSFPSGNQCWRLTDGAGTTRSLCSVLTGY